jgi:peptidoglycan/xylan/chitin deacetylase (PgdA/CDA1 family)
MKKISTLLTAYFFVSMYVVQAQIPGGICNWDNDCKAAIVLTFDDWSPGHYPIVVPELQSRNINATFFVMNTSIASWNHPWPDVVTTASYGNEIANHTKTHPDLTSQTAAQLNDEITAMKALIDQNITTQKALLFAYPQGLYNTAVLDTVKAAGHIAARGVQSPTNYTYNFIANYDDYYKITTYAMGPTVTSTMFNTQVQNVINGGGLLTFLYHSVDDATNSHADTWYSQVKQADLQVQLDKIVSVKDIAWITTFTQAIKYHKERKCATLTETQAPNGTTWKLNLTDTLRNNSIYNQPLSIKLKKNGVNYISVSQNGIAIRIDLDRNDSIMFRAVPDGGEITLTTDWVTATAASQAANANITVSPVPSNGLITIHAFTPIAPSSIAVYDMTGNKLFDKKNVTLSTDIQIDLTQFKEGNYLIYMYEGDVVVVKKVIRLNQ